MCDYDSINTSFGLVLHLRLHAVPHEEFALLADEGALLDLAVDVAEEVEGADWALGGGLEGGLDAGGVEKMEAEEGGDFLAIVHVVVADGALPGFGAVVGALAKTVPVLLDGGGVDALGVDSEVDHAFLDDHPLVDMIDRVLSQKPGDVVAYAGVLLQLKLGLDEGEEVAVALDFASDPALADFYLALAALDTHSAGTVLDSDAVAIALDGDIDLRDVDGDGALARCEHY